MKRADLWKLLSPGTRLRLTHDLTGPKNEIRKVVTKRGPTLMLTDVRKKRFTVRLDDMARIEPISNGFRIYHGDGFLEYQFAPYTEKELKLPQWEW